MTRPKKKLPQLNLMERHRQARLREMFLSNNVSEAETDEKLNKSNETEQTKSLKRKKKKAAKRNKKANQNKEKTTSEHGSECSEPTQIAIDHPITKGETTSDIKTTPLPECSAVEAKEKIFGFSDNLPSFGTFQSFETESTTIPGIKYSI